MELGDSSGGVCEAKEEGEEEKMRGIAMGCNKRNVRSPSDRLEIIEDIESRP